MLGGIGLMKTKCEESEFSLVLNSQTESVLET